MPRPQQSTQIYDENVHGAGARRTRYGTRSQSSKNRDTGQRRALGDISNQERKAQSGKNVLKRGVASRGGRGARAQRAAVKPELDAKSTEMQSSVKSVSKHIPMDTAMDIDEETPGLAPIDEQNKDDPQQCVEYVQEIMEYLKSIENRFRPSPSYMQKQSDINDRMREILVDWLNEVHLKFKLRIETLYLTINLIDRFLSMRTVARTRLQLVGCTAMLIASKYEEIYAPEVRDFVYISDRAYSRDQILRMESAMLGALKFDLSVAYPLRFMQRYAQIANLGTRFKHLASFLCEMTLQSVEFLNFMPSTIGASAVSIALEMYGKPAWPQLFQEQSGLSEEDLCECKSKMMQLLARPKAKYVAVRKKYNLDKFGKVASKACQFAERAIGGQSK